LGFVIRFTKDNRPYLPAPHNKELIDDLKDMGFFDVFVSNKAYKPNGFGVYLSQVILFFQYGVNWIRRGFVIEKDIYEIHHINGNVLDNQCSNLYPVHNLIHRLLSKVQSGRYVVEFFPHKFEHIVAYRKDGKPILKDRINGFIMSLIELTIQRTKEFLSSVIILLEAPPIDFDGDSNDPFNAFLKELNLLQFEKGAEGFGGWKNLKYQLDKNRDANFLMDTWNWLRDKSLSSIEIVKSRLPGIVKSFLRSCKNMENYDSLTLCKQLTFC